ncbi:MAG: N-acetylmuramoyl-L-alanine amidase [Oscillospiraceae bacterium]|jgi:N-acetylmuramoyl-L-alanine amidase|nr:N-acetylmuramoyl-L-alanine amidase [Oscillospiraceae bacterium]
MVRRNLFFLLLIILIISIAGYALYTPEPARPAHVENPAQPGFFAPYGYTPIIDPGHGGMDPGTESVNGTVEKKINLEISLKTDLLMRFLGLNTVMTRDTDDSIHDPDAVSIYDKKVTDINNRTRLVNETENGVLISIHQNYFDQRQYYGAQVFYRGDENKAFANVMQDTLRLALDPENHRESKTISNVSLLNNTTKPAILIECGFLSNEEEEALLRSEHYQRKTAMAIAKGFLDYIRSGQ